MLNDIPSVESKIYNTKNLDVISICDSVLSPAQANDVLLRTRRNVTDYRVRNVDWRMYDLLKITPGISRNVLKILHDVAHDSNVTRRFYNSTETLMSLQHYGGESTRNMSWTIPFRVARTLLKREFGVRPHLEPLSLSPDMDIDVMFSDKSTSAGAIGQGSKLDNWDLIKSTAFKMDGMIHSDEPFSKIFIPAMIFHRAQLKNIVKDGKFNPDYDEKDRLVWGVDAATVLLESRFAQPLIQMTKEVWPGYAGGKTPQQLRRFVEMARSTASHWYSTDYSKFDQTVPDWLIHEAFDIVRDLYDPKYKKDIDWIEYNFINTVLCLPSGKCIRVHKGIPSGSNFTQVIGSICNYLMMVTYLASLETGSVEDRIRSLRPKLGFRYDRNHMRMFVMGDDNLFLFPSEIDPSDLASYVTHVFGVKVNPSKTEHGYRSNPSFLHRIWYGDGEGRDQLEMLINLIEPERWRSYVGYTPLAILFSIYYTFRYAFNARPYDMNLWFSKMFQSNDDITALRNLPSNELPGSAKVFARQNRQYMADAVRNLMG